MRESDRTSDCLRRAEAIIPGQSQLLSKRADQFAPGLWPGYYSRASGTTVWDLDGRPYLDMSIGGIGATILGYAHPEVDEAVKESIALGQSSTLCAPEEVDLAERLCALHPWASRVRFARSGGEALAIAVRVARATTKRDLILCCGYHGWHDWYLAANLGSGDQLGGHLLPGLQALGVPASLQGTTWTFPYNDLDALQDLIRTHGPRVAAVVMEPERDSAPAPGFLSGLVDVVQEAGSLLIFDEVTSGFRAHLGGWHLRLGVHPDIAVFSKAIANGYAMAAVIGTARAMSGAERSFISSTMWTERIGPVAALATIRVHERDGVGKHVAKIGTSVMEGWRSIADRHGLPMTIRGLGPIAHFAIEGFEAGVVKSFICAHLLERGMLGGPLFYAMGAHTSEEVGLYLRELDPIMELVANHLGAPERLVDELKCPPASTGFGRLA